MNPWLGGIGGRFLLRRLTARPDFWKIAYLDVAIILTIVLMRTSDEALDSFHVVFWLMIGQAFFLRRWGFWVRLVLAVAAVETLILTSPGPDWRDIIEPLALVGITITVFILHTTRERARQELRELATLDPLTGVLNRRALQSRLDEASATLARYGTAFAVAYIDLDGFKAVNDAHGHDIGDTVLVEAARRIETATRSTDRVGRIGGDEFAVLLTNTASEDGPEVAGQRTVEALRQPFSVDGKTITISASMGIVVATPGDKRTPAELLIAADRAMYWAKRRERGTYALAGTEADTV
jgi:diguanylate cyclase (GGDEF)-like protein